MVRSQLPRRRFVGVITAATTVGLAGCNGEQDGDTGTNGTDESTEPGEAAGDEAETETPMEDAAEGESFVRVVHAVPDAPNVDVAVDGDVVLEDVAFRTVSEYLSLAAGSHQVQITLAAEAETGTATENGTEAATVTETETATEGAGTGTETEIGTETGTGTASGESETALFDEEVTVPAETTLTIVALGEVDAGTFEVRTFEDESAGDDSTATPAEETTAGEEATTEGEGGTGTETAAGTMESPTTEPATAASNGDSGRLRLLHASPDAPNVDVALEGEDDPALADIGFGEASEYVSLPAGTQTIEVRPAGETDAVATFEVEIEADTPATAFAMGYLRPEEAVVDEPFDLTVATDVPPAANGDGDEGTETMAPETEATAETTAAEATTEAATPLETE
jgi:hypothetical protein